MEKIHSLPNVRVRLETEAGGWYADQWVALVDRRRLTKLRTTATLFATGCIEQPAVFHNNDLPGVLLGSAAQRLIHHYAVRPCQTAVVLAANEEGYRVALDLADAGVKVATVVDLRPAEIARSQAATTIARGIDVRFAHTVYEARSGSAKQVTGAIVCPLSAEGSLDLSARNRAV